MKTNDFLSAYKFKTAELKAIARKINFGTEVSQNIESLIPKQWTIKGDNYGGDIRIYPKAEGLTADRFDKLLAILTKALNIEPDKDIDVKTLHACFHRFRAKSFGSRHKDYSCLIRIEIIAENSERCEIITEEVTETKMVTRLTGYCKGLAEKKYLKVNA